MQYSSVPRLQWNKPFMLLMSHRVVFMSFWKYSTKGSRSMKLHMPAVASSSALSPPEPTAALSLSRSRRLATCLSWRTFSRCAARCARVLLLLGAAAPRGTAAASASRAHREAHRERVRHDKHAADRRDRAGASAVVGSGDSALQEATAGMCNFMEREPFEEYFQEDINATRWDLSSMNGLFHCNRGTDRFCTMASKANFALGAPLPFYPGENVTGAYLTLTQSPCNNPWRKGLCCGYPRESAGKQARADRAPICSNWTGAHARPGRGGAQNAPAAPVHAAQGDAAGGWRRMWPTLR